MPTLRDHDALLAHLAAYARRRFSWRSLDCVRFAARAVQAQTGRDLLAGLRWRTRAQAAALLEREGGLKAAVDRRLARVAPAIAARGDVAGVPDPDFGVRLMIVEGRTLVGPGADGLARLPRSAMTIAWSADAAEDA